MAIFLNNHKRDSIFYDANKNSAHLKKFKLDDQNTPFVTFGIGISSIFAETIIAHPCIIIRRQCQLRHDSDLYHLSPFTLIPVILRIGQQQGIGCLWKGLGSVFIFRGLNIIIETVLGDITSLPKDVNRHSSMKKNCQHLLLKWLSWFIMTPFYAACVVETVQSEIASEEPGLFDCLKEGASRVLRFVGIGAPTISSRLLSLHWLVLPVTFLGVFSFIVNKLTQYVILSLMNNNNDEELDVEDNDPAIIAQNLYYRFYPELLASFVGGLVSDTLLFPLETVIHRLCVQGTRTILDDLDTGTSVAPATAAYSGMLDAVRSIFSQEGFSGFYKGFGALVLQYALHLALLKAVRTSFRLVERCFAPTAYSSTKRHRFPHDNVSYRIRRGSRTSHCSESSDSTI